MHKQMMLMCLLLLVGVGGPPAGAQSPRFDQFGQAPPRVGDRAPQFSLTTLSGETFDLEKAFAIQPVVLEFGSYT